MELLFDKDYILEDDRALLRPLRESDFEHLFRFSSDQPEIWKFSSLPAIGEKDFKDYLRIAIDGRREKTGYPFIVFDKDANAYAGSTRFYDIQPVHKTLQLGYTWYGSEFHRTGLNRHCKKLLLEFAFETLELERVEFRADNDNLASIEAMKKIGCKVDGVLRSNMHRLDGSRRDSIVLSILASEWKSDIKNFLNHKTFIK